MYGNGFSAWVVKELPQRKSGPGRHRKYAKLVAKVPRTGYLKVTGESIKQLFMAISRGAYGNIQANRRGNALYLSRKATKGDGKHANV